MILKSIVPFHQKIFKPSSRLLFPAAILAAIGWMRIDPPRSSLGWGRKNPVWLNMFPKNGCEHFFMPLTEREVETEFS